MLAVCLPMSSTFPKFTTTLFRRVSSSFSHASSSPALGFWCGNREGRGWESVSGCVLAVVLDAGMGASAASVAGDRRFEDDHTTSPPIIAPPIMGKSAFGNALMVLHR